MKNKLSIFVNNFKNKKRKLKETIKKKIEEYKRKKEKILQEKKYTQHTIHYTDTEFSKEYGDLVSELDIEDNYTDQMIFDPIYVISNSSDELSDELSDDSSI